MKHKSVKAGILSTLGSTLNHPIELVESNKDELNKTSQPHQSEYWD